MNAPNWITLGRVALVPFFLALAYGDTEASAVGSFIVFGVASASDQLDGYLARKNSQVTRLGQFMDPLADKLLVGAALVVLVDTRSFPLWAALLIAFREVAVLILRSTIVRGGGNLPASPLGKVKTMLQLAMVSWWLLPFDSVGPIHWLLVVAALVATVVSGAEYFMRAEREEEIVR